MHSTVNVSLYLKFETYLHYVSTLHESSTENIHQLDVHKTRNAYTDRAFLLPSHSQAISKILNDQNSKLLHCHIYFTRNNVHSVFVLLYAAQERLRFAAAL
jgi:hypothetical protein